MSTTENQVNANANAADANDLVGFQTVEVSAAEKGPQLPDPAVHGIVVNAAKMREILTALAAGEKVSAEFESAVAGRGKDGAAGPAFMVVQLFPIPRGNEVDNRKARIVYGAGKDLDLPFADPNNNRLRLTSLMFAPIKKEEEGSTSDTERDLEETK